MSPVALFKDEEKKTYLNGGKKYLCSIYCMVCLARSHILDCVSLIYSAIVFIGILKIQALKFTFKQSIKTTCLVCFHAILTTTRF